MVMMMAMVVMVAITITGVAAARQPLDPRLNFVLRRTYWFGTTTCDARVTTPSISGYVLNYCLAEWPNQSVRRPQPPTTASMIVVRNNEILSLAFHTTNCSDEGTIARSIGVVDVCVVGPPKSNISNWAASQIWTIGADPSQIILSTSFQDVACEIGPSGPGMEGMLDACVADDHRYTLNTESETLTFCHWEHTEDGRVPYEICGGRPLKECIEMPFGTCHYGKRWESGSSLSSMNGLMHPDDIKIKGKDGGGSGDSSDSINDQSSSATSLRRLPFWSMMIVVAVVVILSLPL